MFSEYGFFNEMIKELDPNYLDSKKEMMIFLIIMKAKKICCTIKY